MKTTKKLFVAMALVALSALTAEARSWRINHDAMQRPDFADINAAMASSDVVAGDTLYLDPGCGLTTDQTISKQVTVIGCGYFRADAPHAMASVLGQISINAPYTKIEGVIFGSAVNVRASNVILERCKVSGEIRIGNGNTTAQNVTVRQCYAVRVVGQGKTAMNSAYCTIENCIIMHNGDYGVISDLYFPTIRNCYLREAHSSSSLSESCIFHSVSHATVVNSIYVNAPKSSQIWSGSDTEQNQNNISSATEGNTEAAIFSLAGGDDRRYQLKEDSPARGAAADGGDCGPFGGATPYVLSGLPAGHPYYTKAVIAPRSENDKVKVSLQIKMQNE